MERTIAFIGAGNMGGALLERVCAQGDPLSVVMTRRDGEKGKAQAQRLGCFWAPTGAGAAAQARYVMLCVKPQNLFEVLEGLLPAMREARARGERQVLVSIAAGTALAKLEGALEAAGLDAPVIRVMPNTPAAIGQGILFMALGKNAQEKDAAELEGLLAPCGLVQRVSEAQLEMGGALAGCGPAFAYLFIEALADGGVEIGLPRAMAQTWAAQMVLGAADMVLRTGRHPGELKDAVCSPGGSTIAGVAALERRAFRAAAAEAVKAAYDKALHMG